MTRSLVAGTPQMTDAVQQALAEAGVAEENVIASKGTAATRG